MADIGAQRFDIDSSMDLPADGFTTETDSSDLFLAAAEGDQIILSAGFRDPAAPLDPPQIIRSIEGLVDEWELEVTEGSVRTISLRGRDKIAELLDRQFDKLYLKVNLAEDQEPPDVEFVVGTFEASKIAREIVEAAGLTLSWQCRDYVMLEDFQASGRSFDTLRRLVQPWSQVPQFKVDIFIRGTVVFCRERAPSIPTPNFTFDVKDARILRLTIRKRQTIKYANVILSGKLAPVGLETEQGPGGAIIIFSGEVEETEEHKTFNADGSLKEKVVSVKVIRIPDRIELSFIKQTFQPAGGVTAFDKTAEERVTKEYEESRYTSAGPSNRPRQLRECRQEFGIDPDDTTKTFQQLKEVNKAWGYNERGFQNIETQSFAELKDGIFQENKRIIMTQREVEQLKVEMVREEYSVDDNVVILVSIDTIIQAGLRPAGPRPPFSISSGGFNPDPNQVPMEQIKLEETISTDPKALDNRFSNRHMEPDDLEFIMDQFRRASGNFEYEILLDFLHMPFLQKGSILQLTGLLAEDGVTPITMDPALVVETKLSFDESTDTPSMTSSLRAIFWRDS